MSAEDIEGSKSRTLEPKSGCAEDLGIDWPPSVASRNAAARRLTPAADTNLGLKLALSALIIDMTGFTLSLEFDDLSMVGHSSHFM